MRTPATALGLLRLSVFPAAKRAQTNRPPAHSQGA